MIIKKIDLDMEKVFYDKFSKKFINKYKNILTVGIAFFFSKTSKTAYKPKRC